MRLNHLTVGLVALVAGALVVSVPTTAAAVDATQSTVVSAVPATYTPDINDGVVYSIGQSGSTVVLGGSFSSVSPHGSTTTTAVTNLTAFTAGTGALVTSFTPTTNGAVRSVIAGPTPGTVYVGGDFSSIDGVNARVALISTTTGAIVAGWSAAALNGVVNSLVLSAGQLFVGGYFTAAAKAPRLGLAVLNSATGALSSYATPAFSGNHNYGRNCNPATSTCAKAGTGIKAMDINPAGTRLIAVGNFTTVDSAARDQVALLDVGASAASVDPSWATAAYTAGCSTRSFDTYMRDVQFSPDGGYFVIVATGGGAGSRNTDGTQTSCDTAARYETTGTGSDVRPTWIDYTGNDTFESVAITGTVVYVGGHERWVNNSTGSDSAKEGAVPRPGLVAMDPTNGMPLSWNPGRNPRGAGAFALLATSDGLYVGSDTDYIGNVQFLHRKIAFFPLAGGKTLASNAGSALPGSVFLIGSGTSSSTARSVQWDGVTAPGTPSLLTAVNWSTARGAFEINNEVYNGSTDGNFYQRSFDGTTFGPAVAIDPYDDPVWQNVSTGSGQTYRGVKSNFYGEMTSLTSMFYSGGRVYYTLSGRSQMFWRWFEPDSGVMGADEFTTTDGLSWSHVSGAFLSGSTLYFADSTSKALFKVPFVGGQASGVPAVADSSFDWTSHGAFVFAPPPPPPNQSPIAAFTPTCTALACTFNATASHDPDGTITSYAWTWGDTTSETDLTAAAAHTYLAGGSYQVTLTVTDNDGATGSTTQTINPSTTVINPISFQEVSAVDGRGTSATLAVPNASQPGDELLLFESYASPTVTATVPTGWTPVGSSSSANNNLTTAVFSRSAQPGDAGSNVTVTFSAAVKASLTIADYASASGGIEMEASAADAATSAHTSPTLNGLSSGSFGVSFWTDKSTGTTSWTPPPNVTPRSAVFGTGGGAVSALLVDSGGAVSGSYGGLTATSNATSGVGVEWTIALAGG